jgi:hypothetical protein
MGFFPALHKVCFTWHLLIALGCSKREGTLDYLVLVLVEEGGADLVYPAFDAPYRPYR